MEVVITPEALQQAGQLHEPILTRVLRLIERLHGWPAVSGVRALSGELAGHFRMRTRDYRVQFRVERQTITVEKIGHRDGFYDD
jgi:mRNA-degrading endonuclease RelE of RelBE toxin-antitoxin system